MEGFKKYLIAISLILFIGAMLATQDWFLYPLRTDAVNDTDKMMITNALGDSTRTIYWGFLKNQLVFNSGIVYKDSLNTLTKFNKFLDSVRFTDSVIVLGMLDLRNGQGLTLPENAPTGQPTDMPGLIWSDTRTSMMDSALVFVSYNVGLNIKTDTLATMGWAKRNLSSGGEAIIDSMKTRTRKLSLDYWGSAATLDSSWRAQLDSNFLKIDTTTYILDPLAFFESGDTLYIDTSFINSGAGSMLQSMYDPNNVKQQLVGITASQSITNKVVNGVTLNSTGSATTYLDGSGAYSVPSGTGTGEANDGVNLTGGTGIYAQNNGVHLEFKSLKNGTGISLSSDANNITIGLNGLLAFTNIDNTFTVKQTSTSFNATVGYEINGVQFIDNLKNLSVNDITNNSITSNSANITSAVIQSNTTNMDVTIITTRSIGGTAIIDVTGVSKVYLQTTSSSLVTNFTGGVEGQDLTVIAKLATPSITIQNNSNLNIGSNFNMKTTDVLHLVYTSMGWLQVSRSVN